MKTFEDKYVIKIEYNPEVDDLSASLYALSKIVEGHEKTNKILAKALDQQVELSMRMESIEKGSIKLWIENVLKNTEDREIKEQGFRAFMRQAMIEGRELLLDYMDSTPEIKRVDDLKGLKSRFKSIAIEAGGESTLGIEAMSERTLADAIDGLTISNKGVRKGQKVTVIEGGKEHEVNGNFVYKPAAVEDILLETEVTYSDQVQLIRVVKPDYEGESQWLIKDKNNTAHTAKILNKEWLQKFQNSELPPDEFPYPKSVLRVKCDIVIKRDKMGFETGRHYLIKEVMEVIDSESHQGTLGYLNRMG